MKTSKNCPNKALPIEAPFLEEDNSSGDEEDDDGHCLDEDSDEEPDDEPQHLSDDDDQTNVQATVQGPDVALPADILNALVWESREVAPEPFTFNDDNEKVYTSDIKEHVPEFLVPEADVGPGHVWQLGWTLPIHIFRSMWSERIRKQFIRATNFQGRDYKDWADLTMDMFETFLGLVLLFGMVKFPEQGDALDPKSPFFLAFAANMMSKHRYLSIWRCWKYDATQLTRAEKSLRNKADSFWTVRALVDELNTEFARHCVPAQMLSIDEGGIPTRNRHVDLQYNKDKPHPWHLKLFMLNDAKTGYCHGFFFYQSNDPIRKKDYANLKTTVYPIVRLLAAARFHFKCYVLCTDNWYTSIEVVVWCYERGIYFIGTVRINRAGIPKAQACIKKDGRGTIKAFRTEYNIDLEKRKSIYFTSWVDKKPVHFLSTIKGKQREVSRRNKDKRTGEFTRPMITSPSDGFVYNNGMGGTDLDGQLVALYRNSMRTQKWQPKAFVDFMHRTVLNCHALMKYHCKTKRGDKYHTLKDFVLSLIRSLCTPKKRSNNMSHWASTSSVNRAQPMTQGNSHFPEKVSKAKRPRCHVCKLAKIDKMTYFTCSDCLVGLCIDLREDGEPSCWKYYHSLPLDHEIRAS